MSETSLREELDYVQARLAAARENAVNDWLAAHNLEVLEREERALLAGIREAQDATGLSVFLDGNGIDGHTIELRRLAGFVGPLDRSIRHTAACDVRFDGGKFGAAHKVLASGYLRSVTHGSVGLHITGPVAPPSGERLELLRPTLFERSVERVIRIMKAPESNDIEGATLELASGLNASALSALRDLVGAMVNAGAPTRYVWRGFVSRSELIATVHPGQAVALSGVLAEVKPYIEELTVSGHLDGTDVKDGTFHIGSYRGVVNDGLMPKVRVLLDSDVVARVEVTEAVGPLKRSKPKYRLLDIRRE